MKQSLQERTDILQIVLNSMSEGVLVCDAEGELILINESTQQLLNMNETIRDLNSLIAGYEWLLADDLTPLSKCVRETDTVARLGGDEFVIILIRLKDTCNVEVLANKIVQEMARPYCINRREIRSGPSLGIAVYPKDGSDAGELLQKADLAMYGAKSAGRNQRAATIFKYLRPTC